MNRLTSFFLSRAAWSLLAHAPLLAHCSCGSLLRNRPRAISANDGGYSSWCLSCVLCERSFGSAATKRRERPPFSCAFVAPQQRHQSFIAQGSHRVDLCGAAGGEVR